jgi:ssDNA-binding Zn-finger/Zn-ribbon topoisomerase 1
MNTYEHICPDCGGQMMLRTNRKTDEQFWGCVAYPECTGTREKTGEDDARDEMPSDRYRRNDSRRWRE